MTIWVNITFLAAQTSLLQFLSSTRRFPPYNHRSLNVFYTPFCINSWDCWAWQSQKIWSFWNTQTTNNHGRVKVTEITLHSGDLCEHLLKLLCPPIQYIWWTSDFLLVSWLSIDSQQTMDFKVQTRAHYLKSIINTNSFFLFLE